MEGRYYVILASYYMSALVTLFPTLPSYLLMSQSILNNFTVYNMATMFLPTQMKEGGKKLSNILEDALVFVLFMAKPAIGNRMNQYLIRRSSAMDEKSKVEATDRAVCARLMGQFWEAMPTVRKAIVIYLTDPDVLPGTSKTNWMYSEHNVK